MKLLHTSDWHLGMTVRGGISYQEDQRYAIDRICNIAESEGVDGVIIAGDIFDKSIASSDAISLYDEAMTRLCVKQGLSVYMIAGNHDGSERLSQCNELLKKSGLHIAGSLKREALIESIGNVDIFFLPWISTDKVKAVFPEQADKIGSMEDAYRVVLDKYREKFVKGHVNILVAHAFIVNANTSVSDRAAEVGSATMVGSQIFEGFDYVALGHLHGAQKIDGHIFYSGTFMPYSFGKEEKQEKGVYIFDTDTKEIKFISVPLLHKRVTISGNYDELISMQVDEELKDAYVRLEINDMYLGMELISSFREKHNNLLEVSGKSYEGDNSKITMTLSEFESVSDDPKKVFEKYCEDIMESSPNEHIMKLFDAALSKYEKEMAEL